MSIHNLLICCIAVVLSAAPARAQNLSWQQVEPGIWKAKAGKPEAYDLLTASGAEPREEGLTEMGDSSFPLPADEITARVVDGQTYLRFPLDRKEQLYGFGLNFKTVHQRGRILRLHVDHYGGEDNGRTHAPTPFYVSSKGYGVFINSARYIKVYAGTAARKDSEDPPVARDRNTDPDWTSRPYSDSVEMLVPAEGAEVYIFGGPTPLDAVRRYNLFNGGGPLPPRWGLGFTQRVHRLYSAEDIRQEAEAFAERGYPLDFIGLEPGWQSKSYPGTFEWDGGRFPEPRTFVREMLDKGIRLNLWINPYVSPDASFADSIAPYTASHTVWAGMVPDFNTREGRNIFFSQLEENQVDRGVSGYKIDEVDGYDRWVWPDVATFPSGVTAEQMRQTYGLLVQRYSEDMFEKRNRRTFGLVRASNGGGTSFPYVIYNDYYNHRNFITALINSSFSGVLWTPEVRASETGEEWLRRVQSVVFSPMAMINAWSSGTKPWSFAEVEQEVREMFRLRMRMMPYWYSEYAKYHFKGIPPFRAMNLEEGFRSGLKMEATEKGLEENPYAEAVRKEINDQYMAGEYLLVAPMFEGQESREVVLPDGRWYDFYTGNYVGESEIITVSPGLDKIPVFVKDGGIIPMMPARMHAPGAGEKVNIQVRHYGEKAGSYLLYDDDGLTYDYEDGEYQFREIRVEKAQDGRWEGTIAPAEKNKPNTVGEVSWRFMPP
ncbi:TIM-barrel domain-containing protein [Fodinibius sediminis]|uniref:Alpha-D-xyloside xylohydrolase n=1 Tax=Fodinibius sediminis TaxID=1214077 RepID=A0A521C450_9BACT|nr:TIM-barrel domain-containing protein [Fodinibius sediminis]SMO54257.1 alpha-D-xyloside xylohydrolase [Fodinibius sediminis]